MTRQRMAQRRRQLATLRAYVEEGTIKAAAHRLGIAEQTARKRLAAYCNENDYKSVVQAAYALGQQAGEAQIAHLGR